MYRIDGIKVSVKEELTKAHIAKKIRISPDRIVSYRILKKAIDARKKNDVFYVYCVLAEIKGKVAGLCEYVREEYRFLGGKPLSKSPVIVGTGPCGLFAGLMLARSGCKPILIERGADVDSRRRAVENFWNTGELQKTNVQFGEGGAGTFSDGKLNSGINDVRCQFILKTFAEFGAPEEITYTAKPHIGTDILVDVVKNIRCEIERLGGQVRFGTTLVNILMEYGRVCGAEAESENGRYIIDTDNIILAIGHSARDTYEMLYGMGVKMEQKNFSVGVRIEHHQNMINKSQYGDFAEYLGAADYKLSVHLPDGRSAYTFCMCPGGYVVASGSEEGCVVTNGMSNSDRNGKNANSALLVSVTTEDFPSDSPLAGVELQRQLERKAFTAGGGNYFAPCQYVGDFLGEEVSDRVTPTYMPGVKFCDISEIFPEYVTGTIREALREFDKKIKGFASGGAVMTAPETRSSAPVRIIRDKESFMSNIYGLYPAGEGAGYAGGIMSAAADGIRVSEVILRNNG